MKNHGLIIRLAIHLPDEQLVYLLAPLFFNNHNSVVFIFSACDDIITCAGMVAKYALLCTVVGGGRSYWLLGKVRVAMYLCGRWSFLLVAR